MWSKNQIQFVRVFSLLLFIVLTAGAKTIKPRLIPRGAWGGNHISIDVAAGSATIDYDCASGTIRGPLIINGAGKFVLRGSYIRERGGPVRSDDTPDHHPARYTGWTDGKRMTLTVTMANTKQELGTFTLVHGRQGRVWKCK